MKEHRVRGLAGIHAPGSQIFEDRGRKTSFSADSVHPLFVKKLRIKVQSLPTVRVNNSSGIALLRRTVDRRGTVGAGIFPTPTLDKI